MLPQKKIQNYLLLEKIGSGNFSEVWKSTNTKNNTLCAIKILDDDKIKEHLKVMELMESEIKVLRECNSENLVKFYDNFECKGHYYIVMEYCNAGDLAHYIESMPKERIKENDALDFLKQLLNGFKELHRVGAIHRDFKLENVLLNDGVLKIADLGFSKQADLAKTTLGTRGYMAPEIMKYQKYDNKVDMWSVGICLYRMVFGEFPFNGKNQYDLLQKMDRNKIEFNVKEVKCSDDLKDLIKRMLLPDPKKRIEWIEIYKHKALNKSRHSSILGSFIKIMKKEDIKIEYQNIIFQKNKEFYEENSKVCKENKSLNNDLLNNKNCEEEKNNQYEEVSIILKDEMIDSFCCNKEYSIIEENLIKASENIKENEKKEDSLLKPSNEKIEQNGKKNENFDEKNKFFERSEQQFQEPNKEEIEKFRQKIEEKKRVFSRLENRYLLIRNIISFHAKILEESYGLMNSDWIYFQFIWAKRIFTLTQQLIDILEEKKLIRGEQKKSRLEEKNYFQEFTRTIFYEKMIVTFKEEQTIYKIYFDSLLNDVRKFGDEENPIYLKLKHEFNKEKMVNWEDFFKEILIDHYLLFKSSKNKETDNCDKKKMVIHLLEIIDLFDYKENFKFDESVDGGFDFEIYEDNFRFQEIGDLAMFLEEKVHLLLNDN